MIEKVVLDYLKRELECDVSMEAEAHTGKYAVIEKTGSSREDFVETATFAIQSYADSMYEAASLNDEVKEAMYDIAFTADVSKCSLNSDYNFTDTSTKKYRYQAVFDLTF